MLIAVGVVFIAVVVMPIVAATLGVLGGFSSYGYGVGNRVKPVTD